MQKTQPILELLKIYKQVAFCGDVKASKNTAAITATFSFFGPRRTAPSNQASKTTHHGVVAGYSSRRMLQSHVKKKAASSLFCGSLASFIISISFYLSAHPPHRIEVAARVI